MRALQPPFRIFCDCRFRILVFPLDPIRVFLSISITVLGLSLKRRRAERPKETSNRKKNKKKAKTSHAAQSRSRANQPATSRHSHHCSRPPLPATDSLPSIALLCDGLDGRSRSPDRVADRRRGTDWARQERPTRQRRSRAPQSEWRCRPHSDSRRRSGADCSVRCAVSRVAAPVRQCGPRFPPLVCTVRSDRIGPLVDLSHAGCGRSLC